MAIRIEYADDYQGYTNYAGHIREQNLGFAKIRRIRQYKGENPHAGRHRRISPSNVGELVNPYFSSIRGSKTSSNQKMSNFSLQLAIALGEAFHQGVLGYHISRGEYVKEPLPVDPRKRKKKKTEAEGFEEEPYQNRLTQSIESLQKYKPELLLKFRDALKRYHQFHYAFLPRSLSRLEESFSLEIRLGDKIPPGHQSQKSYSPETVRLLFDDDPKMLAKYAKPQAVSEQQGDDRSKLFVLTSGMGLKVVRLNGKYDAVEEVGGSANLAEELIPIDLKWRLHEGNPNDLLQIVIQWLSLFPHRVDRLSINKIPPLNGKFYASSGDIFQVTSLDPVLTAFYATQELVWANLATRLSHEMAIIKTNHPQQMDNMFEQRAPEPEFAIGSRRFNFETCLEQARISQGLCLATLNEEKIGSLARLAEPLRDEDIDKIISDAQRFTVKWRIEHKKELAENKIGVMVEQVGALQNLRGQKGKETWVTKTAWGRSPTPPPLPEPDPKVSGQYSFLEI